MAAKKDKGADRPTPVLEWIAAAFGAVTAVVLLAMILAAAPDQAQPPSLSVKAVGTTSTANGWRVDVAAANAGGQAAAQVAVLGTLTVPGAPVEERRVTIDYVPGHSSAKAGLMFQHNPAKGRLELRAEGFTEP